MRVALTSFAGLAVVLLLGCGDDPTGQSPSGSSSSAAGTGSAGSGAGGATSSASSATGSSSTASAASTSATSSGSGSGGAGGGATGTGGKAGDAGSGGTGAADASADVSGGSDGGLDSGAPRSDARRDVIVADGPSKSRHTMRPLGTVPAAKNGFWEYLPPNYGDGTLAPLLVFWHGVGEDGNGSATALPLVLRQGPPKYIDLNQWPAARPFVVLSPQHGPTNCPTSTEIHDFITFAVGAYDVDPARVYLTGLSCGAIGSASYLGQYRGEQIAAAVLIAGNATAAYQSGGCQLLSEIALWVFHGDADTGQAIAPDNAAMASFMMCPMPHKDTKYTVWPGAEHQPSWERTYDLTLSMGTDIYAWMLMQHK